MDYPYTHYDNGLRVKLTGYSIDGTDTGTPPSDRLVELTGWAEWSTVTITGTVTIESSVFGDVFPTEELKDDTPPARLLLVGDCRYTHDRGRVAELEDNDGGVTAGKAYEWELTMNRDNVFAQVALTPVLVRSGDGGGPPGEYAWVEGQQVADGPPATVVTDDVEEWLDGHMAVKLKPFSKSGLPKENLFSLDDARVEEPVLWINSEQDLVANLLTSRVPAGPKADLRDALASQLAHPVWVQLVMWTAAELGEDANWKHAWQEAVLENVVAPMWDLDTAEEAARKLHEYISEDPDTDGTIRELSGDLNAHIQRRLESGPKLTDLVATQESD
ncbi:hypothetical protein [Halogranum rubrum]|uniref:Uncharacterized protein n=1 Tax=Halogranum salarium B-1 TaxID=1210908 RepID=J3EU14_9EURY|nr:hypothetical protein [Halogranum salarium]EJN57752.1 hypothetical protein HSB1_39000 [Halogranum salarium B-1]